MKARWLIPLYLFCVTLPLLLAALDGREPRGLWDELATAAGILAFAIILVEFVLSGRFRPISNRIGMDVTMRFHQLLARTAIVLAIVHPFLYRAPYSDYPRPWDTTRQETLIYDFWSIAGGALALVLLPAFVLISIHRDRIDYRYETWRLLHGAMAVLIAAGLLHHALSAGRYSAAPAMTALWVVLFAGAIATLAVVYVVRPLGHLRRPWVLSAVEPAGERQWEIEITPKGHEGMVYSAGQFGWLSIGQSAFSLSENPFSFSSAPSSGPALRFLIKELGDFTSTVGHLQPGLRAYVDGPHGNLVVDGREEPGIALIAGGIGIAPLLGILRELRLRGDPRPTVLLYGNRTAAKIAHGDELETLAHAHGTDLILIVTEPATGWNGRVGRIDPDLLREVFGHEGRTDWLFVLCGPPAMLTSVEDTLIGMGVDADRVLSERFQYD